jgi:hypothetical protein
MFNVETPIKVEGDPNAVDSFAACVTAVLRAWGRGVIYEHVEGLSGMAFSPICNDGEDCIGWKMDGANEYRVDFLGRCLGFTVERLGYEGGNGWLEEYGRSGAVPSASTSYFDGMSAALQAGKMVIVRTWPAWSVLVGWDDDLRKLPFATTPRFDKVVASIYPPCKTNSAFALTRATPEISEREAIGQAIAFGWRVASGDLSRDTAEVRFGSALFDAIIACAGEQFLCPSCKENDCMGRSFKRIADGQHASIRFLQGARKYLVGQPATDALDQAILDYTEMSEVTDKYLDWKALKAQHDLAQFRRQLAADVAREKSTQSRAAAHLKELAETLQ